MKLTKNIAFLVSMVMLLGLAGCAHYKAKPLAKLQAHMPSKSSVEKESVSMKYRIFSKADCKKYLDRDVQKKGYQPIHLAINNNTSRSLEFSTKNIALPCALSQMVAQEVHTNTAGRYYGYGLSGVATLPLGFGWIALVGLAGPGAAVLAPLSVIPIAFTTAAIVDGIGSAKSNRKLDADFARKSLRDREIMPYDSIDGLIFVPVEKFDESDLAITLFDKKDGSRFVLTAQSPLTQVKE